jgi:hypothetical protein
VQKPIILEQDHAAAALVGLFQEKKKKREKTNMSGLAALSPIVKM